MYILVYVLQIIKTDKYSYYLKKTMDVKSNLLYVFKAKLKHKIV